MCAQGFRHSNKLLSKQFEPTFLVRHLQPKHDGHQRGFVCSGYLMSLRQSWAWPSTKGLSQRKERHEGLQRGLGNVGCVSNVSFAVFNIPYFRSNCFLQPDSPTKGTRWQKISSARKLRNSGILPSPQYTLHVGTQTHCAVCSHSASGSSCSWTCSPEGFARLPEGIPSSSCTQLMAPVDVCKAIMEFRVPITRFLPELCSDSWSQTRLSLLKFSPRFRHGFRLCHCNPSQFQDGIQTLEKHWFGSLSLTGMWNALMETTKTSYLKSLQWTWSSQAFLSLSQTAFSAGSGLWGDN